LHARSHHLSYSAIDMLQRWDGCRHLSTDRGGEWCPACLFSKLHKPTLKTRTIKLHIELWQHASADLKTDLPVTCNGFRHLLVIVEWKSGMFWTFPLRKKSDGQALLILWMKKGFSHFGRPLGHLHIDNGELRAENVTDYANGLSVVVHTTDRSQPNWERKVPGHGGTTQVTAIVPKAHHQNAKVERQIRTVTEGMFAATRHAGADDNLWDYTQVGFQVARNAIPSSANLRKSHRHMLNHQAYIKAKKFKRPAN
jgi:hypothetical protein